MLPSDSGPEPSGFIMALQKIACFPSLILFEDFFAGSFYLLFIGFFINALFYSLLIERIITIFFMKDTADKNVR